MGASVKGLSLPNPYFHTAFPPDCIQAGIIICHVFNCPGECTFYKERVSSNPDGTRQNQPTITVISRTKAVTNTLIHSVRFSLDPDAAQRALDKDTESDEEENAKVQQNPELPKFCISMEKTLTPKTRTLKASEANVKEAALWHKTCRDIVSDYQQIAHSHGYKLKHASIMTGPDRARPWKVKIKGAIDLRLTDAPESQPGIQRDSTAGKMGNLIALPRIHQGRNDRRRAGRRLNRLLSPRPLGGEGGLQDKPFKFLDRSGILTWVDVLLVRPCTSSFSP